MMEAPELAARRAGQGPGGVPTAADDLDFDVNRVVWDPEYRAEVLAEMRRRRQLAEAPAGRPDSERSRAA